jgi:Caspase domain
MSLKGAVGDALGMREWLLSERGGNVPTDQLTLLLSPRPRHKPKGVVAERATLGNLVEAIDSMLKLSGEEGERLFFFFAGHGLSAVADNREVNALVAEDFTWVQTLNSLTLSSVTEYFETTMFADQFFFIDACRNVPAETSDGEPLIPGRWGRPRKRNPGQPPVQQFILYATSPGLRAVELPDEGGAFTDALLDGLRGAGSAKVWSPSTGAYDVRWNRLVRYVRAAVRARELPVDAGGDGPVYQVPNDTGTRGVVGRDDPVLASLAAEAAEPVPLTIALSPSDAASRASVRVYNELADEVRREQVQQGDTVSFELPPRTYALRAAAPDYGEVKALPPVELYEPRDPVMLKLTRGQSLPREEAAQALGETGTAARGSLAVRSDDPLTSVEVLDSAGVVIAVASGRLHLPAQDRGFYSVRLRLPEGPTESKSIELLAGDVEELAPPVPEPTAGVVALVRAIGGSVSAQNLVIVSDSVGPMASVQLSTIVVLAAGQALVGGGGEPLAKLGLPALEPVPEGSARVLALTVGTGAAPAVRVRLWPFSGKVPPDATEPIPTEAAANVTQVAITTSVGQHWLSLEPQGGAPMVCAVTALPDRATILVAEFDEGRVRFHQYMPAVGGGSSSQPRALRRLETAQRLLLSGGLEAAGLIARDLVNAEVPDPLGAPLGGYVLLRLGLARDLLDPMRRLVKTFPKLSDIHILRGEAEAAAGNLEEARAAFRAANRSGIPVFGEGLTRLIEGGRTYGIKGKYISAAQQVFERHLTGSMWSIWVPDELRPGSVLRA